MCVIFWFFFDFCNVFKGLLFLVVILNNWFISLVFLRIGGSDWNKGRNNKMKVGVNNLYLNSNVDVWIKNCG